MVTGIALPSGSDKLYTGSKDESVRVWDCQSGQVVITDIFHSSFSHKVSFSCYCNEYLKSLRGKYKSYQNIYQLWILFLSYRKENLYLMNFVEVLFDAV